MEKSTLKKSATVVEAIAIVVGMTIGSGIFLKPGIILGNAGSPAVSTTAWIAGGIITLASALSAAEVAPAIPKSSGLYTYLGELYDERVGFLPGWVQTVISYPASVATQAIAFSIYATYFIPTSGIRQKLLATGVLIFILVMNILSTKYGGIIQTLATAGKLIPIVTIVSVSLLSPSLSSFVGSSQETLQDVGFGVAILGTLWAYDGWIGVTNMTGGLKNPSKILPRVISIGVLPVTMIYVLFDLAIFHTLPLNQIMASATPNADAANVLFGESGATFITVGIIVPVLGTLNGYLMTAVHVSQVMDERRRLPFSRILGAVHPKLRAPANTLISQSLLTLVYIFFDMFNTLTDPLVFVLWIFSTMGILDIFILRKRQRPEGGEYRAPLYPITPIIGAMDGVYILISTLIDTPLRSVIRLAITLLDLPMY